LCGTLELRAWKVNLQVILVPDYLHKVEEESGTLYQTLPLPWVGPR